MIFLVQNLTPPWAPPALWLVICRGAARDWQAATWAWGVITTEQWQRALRLMVLASQRVKDAEGSSSDRLSTCSSAGLFDYQPLQASLPSPPAIIHAIRISSLSRHLDLSIRPCSPSPCHAMLSKTKTKTPSHAVLMPHKAHDPKTPHNS